MEDMSLTDGIYIALTISVSLTKAGGGWIEMII
jgi:hypothetical protein